MNDSRWLHLGASLLLKPWVKILPESFRTWEGPRETRIPDHLDEHFPQARYCAKSVTQSSQQPYSVATIIILSHFADEKMKVSRG